MNNAWQGLFEVALLDASRQSQGMLKPPLSTLFQLIDKKLKLSKLHKGLLLWLADKTEANMHKFLRYAYYVLLCNIGSFNCEMFKIDLLLNPQ